MFGTDAIPRGYEIPQQAFGDQLYEIYFRFLETEDEYFDYEPTPAPRDGHWCIHGLGLPQTILRKVFNRCEGAGDGRAVLQEDQAYLRPVSRIIGAIASAEESARPFADRPGA